MNDIVAKSLTLRLRQLWHVFEVMWALRNQGAFLDELDHVGQAAFIREELCIGQQVLSRDADQRVADPAMCQRRKVK